MSRTFDVIDGKLRLTDSGVRVWYTVEDLRRAIASLKAELVEWRRRLAMLEDDSVPALPLLFDLLGSHSGDPLSEPSEVIIARIRSAWDNGCRCDMQDTPDAPDDWHHESCPCYRPTPPETDTFTIEREDVRGCFFCSSPTCQNECIGEETIHP